MVNILNDNKKKTKSDYKNTPREELIREISKAEDAKTEEEKEARKNVYTPRPKWQIIGAWVLLAIVVLGVINVCYWQITGIPLFLTK